MPNCNKPSGSSDSFDYSVRQDNYQSCLLSILGRQSNFRTNTANYNVRAVDDGVSLFFEPKSDEIGEDTSQLVASGSQFQQVLANNNAEKDYLVFIVRPDSFEAFREARKQAWAKGYDVGWEPHPQQAPIKIRTILGSELPGGRTIRKQ